MARLEKWSVVGLEGAKPLAVRGAITGDERFSDGTARRRRVIGSAAEHGREHARELVCV
jgi:hypothetical protein